MHSHEPKFNFAVCSLCSWLANAFWPVAARQQCFLSASHHESLITMVGHHCALALPVDCAAIQYIMNGLALPISIKIALLTAPKAPIEHTDFPLLRSKDTGVGGCNHQHARDDLSGGEKTIVACKPLRSPHPGTFSKRVGATGKTLRSLTCAMRAVCVRRNFSTLNPSLCLQVAKGTQRRNAVPDTAKLGVPMTTGFGAHHAPWQDELDSHSKAGGPQQSPAAEHSDCNFAGNDQCVDIVWTKAVRGVSMFS